MHTLVYSYLQTSISLGTFVSWSYLISSAIPGHGASSYEFFVLQLDAPVGKHRR